MNLRSTKLTTPIVQLSSAIALTCAAVAGVDASAPVHHTCRQGDRGRLIGYEKVASPPTPHDAGAHFEEWIAFYQDFFNFPENLPVTFEYGFDSYKVTYCTDDAVLPGQSFARTTSVTGMVSVPRKSGPLPTVAYVHGTSTSFYDAPSNPNTSATSTRGGRASRARRPRPSSRETASSTSRRTISVWGTRPSRAIATSCGTSSTTSRPSCRRQSATC
jgi:hypothetical protein